MTVTDELATVEIAADPVVSGSAPVAAAHGAPTLQVQLKMLDAGLEAPSYAHPGDAGADLRAREDVVLQPGERKLVPTGVSIALPDGFVALIHPRSGLATKQGLTIVNAPGTVDAGYRGEIAVTLLNTDAREAIELRRGDRIAQMVIQRVEYAQFVPVSELSESVRGAGGFGSTGGFTPRNA
ncbi:MAG: dUTP diphosphatase [Pseudarthrobacter sp.]